MYDEKTGRYVPRQQTNPVKAIREHCVECMGGSWREVNACTTEVCALWKFRFGKNPYRKEKTEAEIERARKLGRALHGKQ